MKTSVVLSVLSCAATLLLVGSEASAAPRVWVAPDRGMTGGAAKAGSLDFIISQMSPGDILLLPSGTYGAAVVNGKGISIVADAGADVSIHDPLNVTALTIKNVPAGQAMLVFGIKLIDSPQTTTGPTLDLRDNQGAVWIEQCQMSLGWPAVSTSHCANVTLVDCSLSGHDSSQVNSAFPYLAAQGLVAETSSVSLEHCTVTGGNGHNAAYNFPFSYDATPGAAAVSVASGQVFAGSCTLKGGVGANGAIGGTPGFPFCLDASPGGTGLELTNGAPAVSLLDTALTVGAIGTPSGSCPGPTNPGPFTLETGVITNLAGVDPVLATNSPVREGQTATITLTGTAGSAALLTLSIQPGFHALPKFSGVLALALPTSIVSLGSLPAGGTLVLQAVVPPLPPSVQSLVVSMQAVVHDPVSGHFVLGNPTALVLLDSSL